MPAFLGPLLLYFESTFHTHCTPHNSDDPSIIPSFRGGGVLDLDQAPKALVLLYQLAMAVLTLKHGEAFVKTAKAFILRLLMAL